MDQRELIHIESSNHQREVRREIRESRISFIDFQSDSILITQQPWNPPD